MKQRQVIWLAGLLALLAGACSPDTRDDDGTPDAGADGDTDTDTDADGDSDSDDPVDCEPGEIWCSGTWIAECNETGDGWILLEDCAEEGLVCAAGECVDMPQECADAINERSYIGCEYWGTTLANRSINYDEYGSAIPGAPFYYAIVVANDWEEDADVHVTDGPGGVVDNDYVVPAGDILVIEDLPWKTPIKEPNVYTTYYSRKVANAAYRLTSNLPVSAYQFNPLHYSDSDTYYSYTNDASLLLPSHVYRREYVVIARPTMKLRYEYASSTTGTMANPGLLAILGSADEPITVDIDLAAYTLGSDSLSNHDLDAGSPGETLEDIVIEPYEVLQLLSASVEGLECGGDAVECGSSSDPTYFCCDTPPAFDLTGTRVTAADGGPSPAVFGGHDCTFVPFNKWACDHLEHQMFPLETWGTRYICAHHRVQDVEEPTIWRIMSGSDANTITFTPASVHDEITLDKGEYIEFAELGDFEVEGTGRIAVAQFMPGQNYTSDTAPPPNGDPAMSLAVPVEQYRTEYTFLAPTSYVHNYITAIYEIGEVPLLDGSPVVGGTVEINDEYARTNMTIEGGIHYIESEQPFAITVHGVGRYTSYMYPGGLDLAEIEVGLE